MPMYMIPTGPGRSRILWCMLMPDSSIPAPVKWMQALTPKWLQHLGLTPQVLDGDTGLLHGQVRTYFGVHTGLEWILLISLFRACIAMTLRWGMVPCMLFKPLHVFHCATWENAKIVDMEGVFFM